MGDAVGTIQDDLFEAHNHGGGDHTHSLWGAWTRGLDGGSSTLPYWTNTTTYYGMNSSGNIIATNGGSETRPVNASVVFIIKI